MGTVLMLALFLPAQGDKDAEQLFRQMEAALSKAKTVEVSFDAHMEGATPGKFKGSLISVSGNKGRLEVNGEAQDKMLKLLMVADGSRMKTSGIGPGGPVQDVPKKLDEIARASIARAGLLLPLITVEVAEAGQKPKEFTADEQMPVSGFRLGKKEKLGERDAQVLEYKLTLRMEKETVPVSVWLDAKTNLPLKRVLTLNQGDQRSTLTEIYSSLVLDGKVDAKKFELPK